ncbi:hypothetical protein Hanom_Chr15g01381621 [Helianthus anomalus]
MTNIPIQKTLKISNLPISLDAIYNMTIVPFSFSYSTVSYSNASLRNGYKCHKFQMGVFDIMFFC